MIRKVGLLLVEIEIVAMYSIDEGYGPLTIKAVDSAKAGICAL